MAACDLCDGDGGRLIFKSDSYRVVLIDDAAYPGFCRVIWNDHVKEMTDLETVDRNTIMHAVWAVEAAVREIMHPEKINLASFGNMTPHVHWHVIPRYTDDAHFPSPVWAESKRDSSAAALAERLAKLPQLSAAISRHLES